VQHPKKLYTQESLPAEPYSSTHILASKRTCFRVFIAAESGISFFRTVLLEYLDDMTVSGVAVYRYGMSKNSVDSSTTDSGAVCQGEEHSLPQGVVNVTACLPGAPALIFNPHFFHADPCYVSQVAGLQPEADKHQFYTTPEPVSKIK